MKHVDTPSRLAAIAAAELRLADRLARRLDEATRELPQDINERLRVARSQAVEVARKRRATAHAPVLASTVGGVSLGGPSGWWLRLASVLPLAMLVAGFLLIQQHQALQQIDAAAQIDAALLTDDLPPDAYRDPGFTAFLRAADEH